MDVRDIALRDALRNDLPRLVARQEELDKALNEPVSDLRNDPMTRGFKLAANFPEIKGLIPMLSSINIISVDDLYQLAAQIKVPDGVVQASATILGRFYKEDPLLMAALIRIFPLREKPPEDAEQSPDTPTTLKASATANLRRLLAGGLWSYAGDANDKGSFADAVKALEQAVALAHEAGDWLLESWALWKLALIDPNLGTPQSLPEFQKTPSDYLKRAHVYYIRALQILDTTPAAQDSQDADSLKIRLLLLLCATTLFENPNQTIEYAKRAYDIGVRRQNKSDIFGSLTIAGTALVMLNAPRNALPLLLAARSIALKMKDTQMLSHVLMQLASVWSAMNHTPLANATMTASILLGGQELTNDLLETSFDALDKIRESAHIIQQEGKTEEFLQTINQAIDSIASKLETKETAEKPSEDIQEFQTMQDPTDLSKSSTEQPE